MPRGRAIIDLSRWPPFGGLVAIRPTKKSRHGSYYWLCACRCGRTVEVLGPSLRSGRTTSCGCASGVEHGHTRGGVKSHEYACWLAAKCRCHNANHPTFADYGARGVTVCRRWRASFSDFLSDMGPAPSPSHELDRVRGSDGYWCGRCVECAAASRAPNCRWATRREQTRNTKCNRFYTHGGVTLCVSDWAAHYGVTRSRLTYRIERYGPAAAFAWCEASVPTG